MHTRVIPETATRHKLRLKGCKLSQQQSGIVNKEVLHMDEL